MACDPRKMSTELEKALCVLSNQPRKDGDWLTSADISRILREENGMQIHWRTVATQLDKNRALVSWTFALFELFF